MGFRPARARSVFGESCAGVTQWGARLGGGGCGGDALAGTTGLAFALELRFEALVALWDLFACVGAGERREEQAETFAFELEFECQFRARASVERFDGDGPGRRMGPLTPRNELLRGGSCSVIS